MGLGRGRGAAGRTMLEFVARILTLRSMHKPYLMSLLALPLIFLAGCQSPKTTPQAIRSERDATVIAVSNPVVATPQAAPPVSDSVQDIRIVLQTSQGPIEATLFASKTPLTVANFLNLAQRGYYDGLTFHRVIPNFMIQGGDPTGSGRGGPGYQFEDEFHPDLRHHRAGLFSMANAGPRTNGSQFFITHNATPWLDGKHSVFGAVTQGQSVVDAIRRGATIEKIEVLDSTELLFREQQQRIAQWNAALTAKGY
jgi:peptidyl-prolyl cis-trans isomerase B (cyclophilin B)